MQKQLADSAGNAVADTELAIALPAKESPPETSQTGTSGGSPTRTGQQAQPAEPPDSKLPGAAVPPAPVPEEKSDKSDK